MGDATEELDHSGVVAMFFRSTIHGLAMTRLEPFAAYERLKRVQPHMDSVISRHVELSLACLPWFFRLPVRVLSNVVGCLSVLIAGRLPARMSTSQRSRLVALAKWIPLFSLLDDLVRSLATLKFFDLADSEDVP